MGGSSSKHDNQEVRTPVHKAQKPTTLSYDPRSPAGDRTPIQVNTALANQSVCDTDPRSPTAEVPRTPLEGDGHSLRPEDIDPRSPGGAVDRTPIQFDIDKALAEGATPTGRLAEGSTSTGRTVEGSTPTGRPPLSRVNGPRGLLEQKQRSEVEQQMSNAEQGDSL